MESRVGGPGGIRRDTQAGQVAASRMRSIVQVTVARATHHRLLPHTVESMGRALGGCARAAIEHPILSGDPEHARARMDEHLRSAVATYVAAGPLEATR